MVGAQLVSTPVEHQHIALAAVEGHELPHDLPCFRDPDYLVYGKSEAGGVLFGGYEHDPAARWLDGVPWDHSERTVPADEARFAPLMAGAAKRFPFLADAGVVKLVCHPDAMTPDGNPLVGELPGVPGFFVAAGLSLNGFGGAGGIGKAVAELVTGGESELDLQSYRPWRFGAVHRDPVYASANAREAYRYYYRLRYPLDSDVLGRPRRTSALHERMQDAGAVFATKNGWERADYCEPGQPWRRAGEEQRAFGWAEPPYSGVLAEESAALRERVGLIDMTSFGKIAVEGPGAAALLERVCDAHVDRSPGSVVYTQFLNERGGIVADVTVTRLGEQQFRVVTGAAAIDSDLGWLRLHMRAGDDVVVVRDDTAVDVRRDARAPTWRLGAWRGQLPSAPALGALGTRVSRWVPLAMVAGEDQKFPYHHGFDFDSIQNAIGCRRRRQAPARRQHDQPADRQEPVPVERPQLRAQGPGGVVHRADRSCLAEAAHPRDVREHRRARRRHLRGRGGREATSAPRRRSSARRRPRSLAAVLPSPRRLHADRPEPYVQRRADWIQRQMNQLGGPAYIEGRAPARAPH